MTQVNTELGLSATANISLNQAGVRSLFGKPSGVISLSDGYGKANAFTFSVVSSVSNANLRSLAIAAGWNQTSRLICNFQSGVSANGNNGNFALTVSGSFPNGVTLNNYGVLYGSGGQGGSGGYSMLDGNGNLISNSSGNSGTQGSHGLAVTTALTLNNYGTISAGGGGGGGGGGHTFIGQPYSPKTGGVGGNGQDFYTAAGAGNPGDDAGCGHGGYGGQYPDGQGIAGANGSGEYYTLGGPGAGPGNAISGNAFITWGVTGTIYGPVV